MALLSKVFLKIKIQPNMNGEEKKRQRIYDLLNTETMPKLYEIIWVYVWPPSTQDLNPLDYPDGAF